MSSKLKQAIKSDPSYEKYCSIISGYKFEVEPLSKEVQYLHTKRKSRNMYKKRKLNPKIVSKVALQDQSYRSRIVELIMQATYQYNVISHAQESIVTYLAISYSALIPGRAKADKRAIIENVPTIAKGARILQELSSFLELAGWVQDDIDQAQWAAKLTMKGLEIGLQREHTI